TGGRGDGVERELEPGARQRGVVLPRAVVFRRGLTGLVVGDALRAIAPVHPVDRAGQQYGACPGGGGDVERHLGVTEAVLGGGGTPSLVGVCGVLVEPAGEFGREQVLAPAPQGFHQARGVVDGYGALLAQDAFQAVAAGCTAVGDALGDVRLEDRVHELAVVAQVHLDLCRGLVQGPHPQDRGEEEQVRTLCPVLEPGGREGAVEHAQVLTGRGDVPGEPRGPPDAAVPAHPAAAAAAPGERPRGGGPAVRGQRAEPQLRRGGGVVPEDRRRGEDALDERRHGGDVRTARHVLLPAGGVDGGAGEGRECRQEPPGRDAVPA